MKKSLLTILADFYHEQLPRKLQKITFPFLYRMYLLSERLYLLVFDIFPEVNIYRNIRYAENPELTVLLAGSEKNCRFLLDQLFTSETKTDRRARIPIWKIPSIDRSQANMVLIEADQCFDRFMTRRGFLAIPEWILFSMDISMPVDKILKSAKKGHANNLRLIKKHQFQYEVVRDREKLRFFYDEMYLPYITGRYGRLTLLAPFEQMENLMHRGKLLLVKNETEYVSGMLIHHETSPPLICYLGVRGGRKAYVKQGAISALYLYTILWAKEQGYRELDFGHCRPLLTDGVLWYKKKWGMRIQKSMRRYRTVYLSLCKPDADLNEFLIKNPLICVDGGHFKGIIFVHEGHESNHRKIGAIKRKHSISGLEEFEVISLRPPEVRT
ncbi:hypothetical protein ACFL03_06670 [Thermodesulfobacteriota bacterium]